jgi:hypothetical protein
LQDRFRRLFSRRMTALDMQAWTAVRMIGEAAARYITFLLSPVCAYSCPINATANWRSNYAATPRTLPSAPQSGPCTSLRATEFRARPSRGSSTASSYNREPASRSWRKREAVSPSMTVAATAPRRPRNTHSSEGVVGCRPQSLQVAQAPEQAQRRRRSRTSC